MKILQTFLACLIFLIAQVALSYAVDIKGEVIPVPVDQGIHWGRSVDISGTTLIAGYGSKFGNFVTMTVSTLWNRKGTSGKY